MVSCAVGLHQRHALVKARDLEYAVAVVVIDALHQSGLDAGSKSDPQAGHALSGIRPFECKEPSVAGKGAGFGQTAFDEFQAACDLTVRDLYIRLKVAGCFAAVEGSERIGLCGNGEIS